MPKIDITAKDLRILTALADANGTTPAAHLETILMDLRVNYAGIRHDDTAEETEARISKAERRAKKAKDARESVPAPVEP